MFSGNLLPETEPDNANRPRSVGAGRLFVITGSSGSGKDALIEQLLVERPNLRRAVTAVTRSPRENERDGVNHFFLIDSEFDRWLADGRFLEWANVFGLRYGTPRKEVDSLLEQGFDVVLRIDPQGAASVRRQRPGTPVIYLRTEGRSELARRLHARGEDEQVLARRMEEFAADEEFAASCQYQVLNSRGCLRAACAAVAAIISDPAGGRST